MSYRVPRVTVLLGQLLDLQLDCDDATRVTIEEWRGWHMLCHPDAMEMAAGRVCLFLLAGELEAPTAPSRVRGDAFERWTQREREQMQHLDNGGPDQIGYYHGRVLRLGYASDKWERRGKTHDYDHSFIERGGRAPKLYTDRRTLERSSAAVIVGGTMQITERGIA